MTSSDVARPSRRSGSDVATGAPAGPGSGTAAQPPGRWTTLLGTGLCFGIGYGVVHRLLNLELPQLVQLGQPFEVRPFPGTSLESLRLRVGAAAAPIRADLGVLELEAERRQQERRRQAAAAAPDRAEPDPPEPVSLPPLEPTPAEAELPPADPLPAADPAPVDAANGPTP
jgi:hypothetical protein